MTKITPLPPVGVSLPTDAVVPKISKAAVRSAAALNPNAVATVKANNALVQAIQQAKQMQAQAAAQATTAPPAGPRIRTSSNVYTSMTVPTLPANAISVINIQPGMVVSNSINGPYVRSTGTVYTSMNTTTPAAHGLSGVSAIDIGSLQLNPGTEITIGLPDGGKLEVKADGSYAVIDKDAKITYKAHRVREFNPFLNASDKLEEFIRFCGTVGVRQSEVLRLPMELFVSWLIIEAARADKEPEPELPLIPKLKSRARPQCTGCGRFLSRAKQEKRLEFCAPACFEVHFDRVA